MSEKAKSDIEEILLYAMLNITIAVQHLRNQRPQYAKENLETAIEQLKQVLSMIGEAK